MIRIKAIRKYRFINILSSNLGTIHIDFNPMYKSWSFGPDYRIEALPSEQQYVIPSLKLPIKNLTKAKQMGG